MRILSAVILGAAISACTPTPAATPEPVSVPVQAAAEVVPEVVVPAPSPPEEAMPGGYSQASLEGTNITAAKMLAVDEIYKREPQRAIVENVEAEQQVVAGMNYHFVITMSGGARYGVTVFHSLQGSMEVTNFVKLP